MGLGRLDVTSSLQRDKSFSLAKIKPLFGPSSFPKFFRP